MQPAKIAGVIVILALVIAYFAFFFSTSSSTTTFNNQIAIQLTDPPQVPTGTQSLIISYSALQVHITNPPNESLWLTTNANGTINLLSLVNLTQTIATVGIPNETDIDMVRFNVTSASIEINGTTYNVTLPSGRITAHISESTKANQTSSLLLDLSPTVATILTQNSTIFVLVPSLRAVIVPRPAAFSSRPAANTTESHRPVTSSNSTSASGASGEHETTSATTIKVGETRELSASEKDVLSRSSVNVQISSASISAQGNLTQITLTVANNANQSITLNHAGIFGQQSVSVNATAIKQGVERLEAQINQYAANSPTCNAPSSSVTSTENENTSTTKVTTRTNTSAIHSTSIKTNSTQTTITSIHSTTTIRSNSTTIRTNTTTKSNSNSTKASANATVQTQQRPSPTASGAVTGAQELALSGNITTTAIRAFNIKVNSTICTPAGVATLGSILTSRILNYSSALQNEQLKYQAVYFAISPDGSLLLPLNQTSLESEGITVAAGESTTLHFSGQLRLAQGHIVLSIIPGTSYKVGVVGSAGISKSINVTAS